MKALILGICFILAGFAAQSFADGPACGCTVKVVNVHEHEGMKCEADKNEVMVGHDAENDVVYCANLECSCGSCPAPEKAK